MKISVGEFIRKVNNLGECLNAEDVGGLLESLFTSFDTREIIISCDPALLEENRKKRSEVVEFYKKTKKQSEKDRELYHKYRERLEIIKKEDFDYFKGLFEEAKLELGNKTTAYDHYTIEDLENAKRIETVSMVFQMGHIAIEDKKKGKRPCLQEKN